MTSFDQLSDAALVEHMTAGNREAFASLFRRHQATVFRFCRQMLTDRSAAEDVTQDVFIILAQQSCRFDPSRGSLSTYLYGIARHLVLQRHKQARRRQEIDVDDAVDACVPALVTGGDPADDLARRQLIRTVRLAIARLPIHYREAIVLCELNGISYEEAARIIGCPVGTIRSRLNRGRHLLLQRCRALKIVREPSEVWNPCLTPTKNGC